ncbi:MAG: oxygenase MpaB family protein, partial [Candidatus Saccharimonadales bacterium]
GTIHAASVLVFGNRQDAYDMAKRIHSFHGTVRGQHEGVSYHANDAEAQTWVLAAVFQGAAEAKRRWHPPAFTPEEEESLYGDYRVFGEFFGINRDLLPSTMEELKGYWEDRLNGNKLLQTRTSRELTREIFRFKAPRLLLPAGKVSQSISIMSLDPRLLEKSGLQPTASDRRISAGVDYMMRNTYGHLPGIMRTQTIPTYMAAQRTAASIIKKVTP